MKIVHVIVGLNVGGAELMLRRLVEAHTRLGLHEHVVISLTDGGSLGHEFTEMGVAVETLNMKGLSDTPVVLYRLAKLLRKLKPDLLQTWMYHADLLGGLSARMAGIRHVIWGVRTTDLSQGGNKATLVIRKLCALLSRLVPDQIVCAAHASMKAHVDVGYCANRMLVIPNGFDVSRLKWSSQVRTVTREKLMIKDDDFIVGSVGRYSPVKDHKTFVQPAALISKKFTRAKFLMVGRGLDSSNLDLVDMIEKTGCKERFLLVGQQSDVVPYLNAMDLFCLHSRTEGFPNVLGEAMAVGVPCVSTDVGDAAMLLDNDEFIVERRNPEALAAAVTRLLSMCEDRRHQIGRAGSERIRAKFSMERTAEAFSQLYARRFSN